MASKHDTRAGVAWAALALFLVLTALLVGGWQFAQHKQRMAFETRLEVTSGQVALRLQAFLSDRLASVEELGRRIEASGAPDEAGFRQLSAGFQERHTGFQALNWVSPSGVILWTQPQAANADATGVELDSHHVAGSAWRAARDTGALTVTRPLELLQGGWGFATYRRVTRDGETLGFLNGVFRIREVLDHCLDDEHDRDFSYLLHDGERLVGVHGPQFDQGAPLPGATHDVLFAGNLWQLTVQAPVFQGTAGGAAGTWTAELFLGVGILLAALLAWMVQVALLRQQRSELSVARLRVLVENAPDAIVCIDPESGCFVDSNANATTLFGRSAEELRSSGPGELSPAEQPDGRNSRNAMARYLADAASGKTLRFDWTHLNAQGAEVPTVVHLVRLPDSGRNLVRGSIVDISDKRTLENRLLSSQKMEAMGRLAGGVAHDFNNLLTGILGASELIAMRVEDDEELTKLAGEIGRTCERAGELTRQLLAFSRNQVVKRTALDLSALVRDVLPMLERVLGRRVTVETELDPALFSVMADSGQMELAILNLAINARDAMPDGGVLTIKTRTRTSAETGRRVLLDVIDVGSGIPGENLERIFEPFFTTKLPGVGTGIGLATVKQIVTQAEGVIRVRSTEGEGSTFTIDMPGIAARAPDPTRGTPVPEVLTGQGTILLVEDEAGIRAVAKLSLEQAGYRVLDSATAEEALVLAEEFAEPIDLLITDVVLPGMPGTELVSRLAAQRPETAMLLMSGYSAESFDTSGLLGEKLELLPKPFSPSSLTRKAGELLAARAAARRRQASGIGRLPSG